MQEECSRDRKREGDGSGSPPHRASPRDYLPKSSVLSLKPPLSLTDSEAGPHIPKPNEKRVLIFPSDMASGGISEPWTQRTLMPEMPAFSSPTLKAPPPWAMVPPPHSGTTSHQSSLGFLFVPSSLVPYHPLILPLPLSDSQWSHTLWVLSTSPLGQKLRNPMTYND